MKELPKKYKGNPNAHRNARIINRVLKENQFMKGVIRNLSERNFGFIRASGGIEYFFHRDDFSGFWDDLFRDYTEAKTRKENIEVTFEPGEGLKGPRASNVSRVDFPNQ